MNHDEFKIKDGPGPVGGMQRIYKFPNGYGASVISGGMAYGGLELGVIRFDEDDWHLTYSTPITDDVLGWLTEADVQRTLGEIKALADGKGGMDCECPVHGGAGMSTNADTIRDEELRKIAAYDAARAIVKIEGNTRAYYVLRAEAAEAEVEQLRAALERIKRESGNPGFAPSAIAREALAVRG